MASGSQPEKKMIVLKSDDGEIFEVEEAVVELSETLNLLIKDDCAGDAIPLANIRGKVIAKVLDFCKKRIEYSKVRRECGNNADDETFKNYEKDLREWGKRFVEVEQSMLIEIIKAADLLNIRTLLIWTFGIVANKIKGKTPEEIRAIFSIKNEFTVEEEEAVRNENEWAFK